MKAASPGFEDRIGLERILFFSDAVMAIAITLLTLDLRVPEVASLSNLGPALLRLWPGYLGYLLSFFIIGNHWLGHHWLFRPVRRYDARLIGLNLVFLFFVALLPFSTRLIGVYPTARIAVLVYSLNALPLFFASSALTRHAYAGGRLLDESFPPERRRTVLDFYRRGSVVFAVCLIITVAFPAAFFPVWFLGFASRVFGRRIWKVG